MAGNCSDTDREGDETVSNYDSQPSDLNGTPSDVVRYEDVFAGFESEGPTIIGEDDKRLLEGVTGFVIEFSNVLQRVAKQGDQ